MICQACGTTEVSNDANAALTLIWHMPGPAMWAVAEKFGGEMPDVLCAACVLPQLALAIDAARAVSDSEPKAA